MKAMTIGLAVLLMAGADGFAWFAADVVTVEDSARTPDAITYRFKTEYCSYPFRSSRLGEGNTMIDLIVIMPRPVVAIPVRSDPDVWSRPADTTTSSLELAGISPEAASVLGNPKRATLARRPIETPLSRFNQGFLGRFQKP